jgi:hypothetical protein
MPTQVHINPAVSRSQFLGTPGFNFFIQSIPDYLYHPDHKRLVAILLRVILLVAGSSIGGDHKSHGILDILIEGR